MKIIGNTIKAKCGKHIIGIKGFQKMVDWSEDIMKPMSEF